MTVGRLSTTLKMTIKTVRLVALVLLVANVDVRIEAQQSARSYQQLSGRALGGPAAQSKNPSAGSIARARFNGWHHPEKQNRDYFKHFSRPKARIAHVEILKNASRFAAQDNAAATFAPSALSGFLFRDSLPAGLIPTSVVTGDFNGDGKLDFIVANGGDNNLWLYFGRGDGTFSLPLILPITLGQSPVWVATADLRGIGKTDLIVVEADSDSVGVFLGKGDGTFTEQKIAVPGSASTLAIGDFNHDGKLDIAVPMNDENSLDYIVVLPGSGTGTFGAPIVTPITGYAPEIFWASSADLNGDGFADLVLTNNGIDPIAVQVFLNKGDGTFTAGQVIAQNGGGAQNLGSLLFDADEGGHIDAIVEDSFGMIWFYQGNGDGTFSTNPSSYGVGDLPYGMAVADVNGDGHLDVITSGVFVDPQAHYGAVAGNLTSVLLGDGEGHFAPAKVYRGGLSAFSVAVADFNGDGHPDVVTANQDDDSATVFLNDGKGGFGDPQGPWIGYDHGAVNAPMTGLVPVDVNGDGFSDLALIEWNQPSSSYYQLTVVLNDGTGHFSAPVRSDAIPVNSYSYIGDFVFADFRNTGRPDFLSIGFNGPSASPLISFAPNAGGGQFGPLAITNPTGAQGVIGVGDFNHDGKLDFVAASNGSQNGSFQITAFLGSADGTFHAGPVTTFNGSSNDYPVAVYVGDFNHDSKLDLWIFTYEYNLYELFGMGNGGFQTAQLLFSNSGPTAVADLNHDGMPDLVQLTSVTNPGSVFPIPIYSIYLGQANGAFKFASSYDPYVLPGILPQYAYTTPAAGHYAPMLADFNGDGNLDIAACELNTAYPYVSLIQLLLGNGDGTFAPTFVPFNFEKMYFPNLAIDVNGDGHADLVELDGFRSSLHVLQSVPSPGFQFILSGDPVVGSTGGGLITLALPSSSSTTINITASDPAISVPATVTIPAGQVSQDFEFTIGSTFNAKQVFSLTAQLGGAAQIAYGTQVGVGSGGLVLNSANPYAFPDINLVPGQNTGQLLMNAASQGGYETVVNLQCTGLPAQAACQFWPPTLAISAGGISQFYFYLSLGSSMPQGSYPANIVADDGIQTWSLDFTLNVGDFSMGISPAIQPVFPTGGVLFTVTLTSAFNFNGAVYLTCSGLPAGVSCPSPWIGNPAPGGAQFPLVLNTQNNPAGNYTLTVTGTSNPVAHSTTATLQVWDFSGSISPSSATVKAGGSANFNIKLTSLNGFVGQIGFGCSSIHISCSFNPPFLDVPADGTATSVLTLTAGSQLASAHRSPSRLMPTALLLAFPVAILFLKVCNSQRKWFGTLFLLLALIFVPSCGGGGSGGGGGGGGGQQYSVTIQVSSGNYGKNAGTITLTVD